MFCRFKVSALMFGMLWAALPHLACLVPAASVTQADEDCCLQMGIDCPHSKQPAIDECCTHIVRSDVAMTAKASRIIVPDMATATIATYELPVLPLLPAPRTFVVPNFHAPPPNLSAVLNLRI